MRNPKNFQARLSSLERSTWVQEVQLNSHKADILERAWRDEARKRNHLLAKALKSLGRHEQAIAALRCHSSARMENGRVDYYFSCRLPQCVFCTAYRKRKLLAKWAAVATSMDYPVDLGLTCRDVHTLTGVAPRMAKAFRRIQRLKRFREHCHGGFLSFEFDPFTPERETFHPHAHFLLNIPDPDVLSLSWFKEQWLYSFKKDRLSCTGGYIAELNLIPRYRVLGKLEYLMKPPIHTYHRTAVSEVFQHLRRIHLFRAFGPITQPNKIQGSKK